MWWTFYNPHYEIVKVHGTERTLDELSSHGEMKFKDDTQKSIKKILHHLGAKLENKEYVKKEFEKYHEMEIMDNRNISLQRRKRITS